MNTTSQARLLNITLRAATLASRFLLIFFLARFLDPAQLGLYGLLTATLGYSLYLLGFDFYTFTTREILRLDRHKWGEILKSQVALSLVLYTTFIPPLILIFSNELLPWSLSGWFFALLVLEHLNQEINRLLITISQQLLASAILFLRQGTWAILITALMASEPNTRSLHYLFGAWTAAGIIAALFGVYRFTRMGIGGWRAKIDWKWIFSGLKVSIPLLIATLALRGAFTLDRYWLQSLENLDVVGAYVLFMGISATLMTFLDAGVFSFSYPGLISAYQKNQPSVFRKNLHSLLLQTTSISATFAIFSLLMITPLLEWIGNPIYSEKQYLYPWVLAIMLTYTMSMVPHYALYAQGIDKPIIQSHIIGLMAFCAATWAFSKHWSAIAVPLGLCTAFIFILIWKTWCFFKLTPPAYRSAQHE